MKLAGMSEFGDLVTRLNRAEAMIRQLQGNAPLDIQSINGAEEGYSSSFSGSLAVFGLQSDASTLLRLSYTPKVPCWWEVSLHLGIIDKTDSAYHYIYAGVNLDPADEDGLTLSAGVLTQNNAGPSDFGFRGLTRVFKLEAGVAYTVTGVIGSGNGGTWRYYRSPATLALSAKAFARGDA